MTGHFGPHLSFHSIPLGAYEFAVPSLSLALTYLLQVLAFIIFWRFVLAILTKQYFGVLILAILTWQYFGVLILAILT